MPIIKPNIGDYYDEPGEFPNVEPPETIENNPPGKGPRLLLPGITVRKKRDSNNQDPDNSEDSGPFL